MLISMTMEKTTVGENEEFVINKEVRQSNLLSAKLFNLVIQYSILKVSKVV